MFITLYFIIWAIVAICFTIYDYKNNGMNFEEYVDWNRDAIFVYCWIALAWPVVLQGLLFYYSWMTVISFILSKVKKED